MLSVQRNQDLEDRIGQTTRLEARVIEAVCVWTVKPSDIGREHRD
jgi:hypothetical protein